MLTWRKGGEAMGSRIANDLPKRLAMTPAGRRVLALASPVPSARRTPVLTPAASARRVPASAPPLPGAADGGRRVPGSFFGDLAHPDERSRGPGGEADPGILSFWRELSGTGVGQ